LAFFAGLRLFRLLYSPVMSNIAAGTGANFKNDFTLSIAIGMLDPSH
jgi:hypothetical protein